MAEKLHWIKRPFWQSVFIVCSVLVWCLYLAVRWICSLPPLAQALLGLAVGMSSMASYSATQAQRSHHRRRTSIYLAQLSMADSVALQRLLPNYEKALSWLPSSMDAELVRWINVGLEKAWPYFKEASTGLIKVQLQAVLNKYRSGAIHEIVLGKVNLGNMCPYVQGVKASPINKENNFCLEVQLDWRQNENQELLLHVLTSGTKYIFQVKHFVIFCVMRLTFTPLSEEFPCFGALVISIVEPPLVDFQTNFVSGDEKKVPEMQRAVDSTLVAALMDLLVWPGRVVVPFLPGDYSDLEASCVGHLHVRLVEAKYLANKDIVGRSDPLVVLYVRRREDLIKESSRLHDTNEPVWNEQFLFNVSVLKSSSCLFYIAPPKSAVLKLRPMNVQVEDSTMQKLTIKVMNRDDSSLNVFVGNAELAINQLEANTQEDLWIDLVGDPSRLRGKCAGKVHLLIEYKPLNVTFADSHSISDEPEKNFPSIAPLTQSAGKPHERIHAGAYNVNEGLGAVLEGHNMAISENYASRPITFIDAVAPSSKDSCALQRAEVTRNLTADTGKLVNDDDQLPSKEDKTETAGRMDDRTATPASTDNAAIAKDLLFSEDGSRENPVYGFGTKESKQWITTDPSKLCRRKFLEGSSILGAEKRALRGRHIIVGDPVWGLNGLPLEHVNSSAIDEGIFSTEIFEVD